MSDSAALYSWSYTPNVAPPSGAFYFIGALEHEITEIMGRVSYLNYAANLLLGYGSLPLFGAGRAQRCHRRLG